MKKGKYIVSVHLSFKTYNKEGVELKPITRDISREVELKRPFTKYQIADDICWNAELQLKEKGKSRETPIVYNAQTDTITIYDS